MKIVEFSLPTPAHCLHHKQNWFLSSALTPPIYYTRIYHIQDCCIEHILTFYNNLFVEPFCSYTPDVCLEPILLGLETNIDLTEVLNDEDCGVSSPTHQGCS